MQILNIIHDGDKNQYRKLPKVLKIKLIIIFIIQLLPLFIAPALHLTLKPFLYHGDYLTLGFILFFAMSLIIKKKINSILK